MLKQFEELAVLEQGDDGAIVSVRGQQGPSVLLGSTYLAHLARIASQASTELQAAKQFTPALRVLCAEVQTLVEAYSEACNKYANGGDWQASRSLEAALKELEELRRNLESL